MMGVILSVLATFAVLIFAFHSDESRDYARSRLQGSDRRISRPSEGIEKEVDRMKNNEDLRSSRRS
jgi:hypothetical protein